MDLESEFSVLESVEDNEEIKNLSTPDKLENSCESKVQSNGSYAAESNDSSKLEVSPSPAVKENGNEASGYFNSHHMEMNPEVSPSPPAARKGHGLKKWRRMRRDVSKVGESSIDSGEALRLQVTNSGASSSKRVQVYAERSPKSEGSAFSINAMVRSLDGHSFLGNTAVQVGPSFAAGTDSENSEDRSTKSSTAASAPKIKYERPMIAGSAHGKSTTRTLSGKNFTHSVQRGQQGKSRTETSKKARGDSVKIEKENSQSSLEPDSRSSNFVFVQSNGIRSERPIDYGNEVHGSEHLDTDELRGGYSRDGEEGVVVDSSWVVKDEPINNHSSSADLDALVDSTLALQSVQEALDKELLKFKEISIDIEQKFQENSSQQLLSSELAETIDRNMERGPEDIFRHKIEAEVEYLAISRTIQTLRINIADQLTLLEEQKTLASEQTQIHNKLGDTENKAAMLKKEAEMLEHICDDIASADETLKLQNGVCKYTSCFLIQLVIFVVIIGVFVSKLPPIPLELIPT